jgi:hypothetical protein
VRERKQILAQAIDEVAGRTVLPSILSLACGHMREAGRATSQAQGRIGRFIGLDQDLESLGRVEQDYGHLGVRPVLGSVIDVIRGRLDLPRFGLIYSAGLYDYLPRHVASRLTKTLYGLLAPGGRLLIANFLPGLEDAGYLESFMDWQLVYRDESEMEELGRAIGADGRYSFSTFVDPNQAIVFLDVRRIA